MAPVGTACLDGSGLTCFVSKDDDIAGPGGNDTEASVEAALLAALGTSFDIMEIAEVPLTSGSGTYANVEEASFLTVKSSTHYNLFDLRGLTRVDWTAPTGQGVSHATIWKLNKPPTSAVPEPGAAALFLTGMGIVGLSTRSRRLSRTQ